MRIGFWELIVILIVALLVIGPDKLPFYAKKLGEALAQFRKVSSETAEEIKQSVAEPLDEVQKPLREAMGPLEETRKEVEGSMKDLEQSFRDIGKEKPASGEEKV